MWHERAGRIAELAAGLAPSYDGRLPEHFGPDWSVDLELNRDRPDDPFKPFGATVGHGLEWSRLLLHVEATLGDEAPPGLLDAARLLFDRAVADGWHVDGAPGFVYTTDWDGVPVVRERMHWVVGRGDRGCGGAPPAYGGAGLRGAVRRVVGLRDRARPRHRARARGTTSSMPPTVRRPPVWPGKPDLYHAVQATLLPRLPLAPSLARAVASWSAAA